MATYGGEGINSSTSLDSDSESRLFCSPCQSDEKRLGAIGYCATCKEFLCEQCFKYHKMPSITRNHRLLDREEMIKIKDIQGHINQCQKHEDEIVVYHCPTHCFLGCHICIFQHQKSCKDARYIPDISEMINSFDEFKEFMTKLDCIAEISKTLMDECRRNIDKVETCHTEAYAAIQTFKSELLEAINQLEKELYEKTDKVKENAISKLNPVVDKCLQVQTEIQSIATEMKVLQNKHQNGDLYITMVESKSKLMSLEAELNAAKGENLLKIFKFDVNAETRQVLKSPFGLGKVFIMTEVVKAERMKDIHVKCQDDKINCNIYGSVILPDHRLVISDRNNKSVKVIDTKQQKMLSAMTLSSGPWSLAKVTDNTVAATVPDNKKIVLIRINPALSIDTEIMVDGSCRGVAYSDGKLVVSFYDPHKVEIMDVKGSVLRRIQTDRNGQALFNDPYYVAINPESSLIYVSNCSSHNVVCLRFDGTVVATYKDNELQYPRQVIVDSTGHVYVCGYGFNNVHQMTEDCKKIKVPLTSADGLSELRTISYEEAEGKLYVGRCGNDVQVYRMIYEYL